MMLHVMGVVPVAVNVTLYAVPFVASGRVSVVMVGGKSETIRVIFPVYVCISEYAVGYPLYLNVKVNVPLLSGIPSSVTPK